MCGISGVFGYNAVRLSMLITLGQLHRGTQGTGIAFIDRNRLRIVKEPIHPIKFIEKHYARADTSVRVAICHNRQPSKGIANYVNTHPFLACNREFALIHNGHIVDYDDMLKSLKHRHQILGDTDSELVTHMLEEYYNDSDSMTEAINSLLDTSFSGAILVLTRDGSIYGTRKGNTPLHYCIADRHIFLASEAEAIENVLEKNARIKALKSRQIIVVKNSRVEIIGKGEDEPIIYYPVYQRYNEYFYYPNIRRGLVNQWLEDIF